MEFRDLLSRRKLTAGATAILLAGGGVALMESGHQRPVGSASSTSEASTSVTVPKAEHPGKAMHGHSKNTNESSAGISITNGDNGSYSSGVETTHQPSITGDSSGEPHSSSNTNVDSTDISITN